MTNRRISWIAGWLALWSLSIAAAAAQAPREQPAEPAPAAEEADSESPPSTPDDKAAATKPTGEDQPAGVKLSLEQEQIAERYRRFEELLLRMAELTAAEDPDREALLRQTVAKSKERLVGMQFERIIEMLGADRLSTAVNGQGEVMQDLKTLLDLLLNEDRAEQLKTDQERVRGYLKEVNKLIKEQQGIQAQTGRGGQLDRLAGRQDQLAERTDKLGKQMKDDEAEAKGEPKDENSGEPSEEKSEDGKSSEGKSSDGKSSDGKSSDGKSGEGKPGEDKPKDGKPTEGDAEKKDGEVPEGKKPGEGDPKDPSDGKPSDSKPSDAKPSDGKPSESGEPSDSGGEPGKPSDGKPQPGQPQPGGQPSPGEGEPSDSPPGQQPPPPENDAQQRVKAAQQRMRDAQEKLEKALREEAVDKQEEALRELEAAKAELERILRQMREEEMARLLAMLEARFRKMLEMQVEVYEGTVRLDRLPMESRGRGSEIESGRLSQSEAQIAIEADKALALLREEGSAVAMPEALEQARDDMEQVTRELADFDVGEITQALEEDIIAALEEMIAALEKAQQDLEAQQNQQQPPPPGEPQEPPLVDQLAELRMIRSLQMRVNRRTQTYSKLIDGEQADKPELLEALEELAQRQNRIYRTTRDIVVGKNE